VEQRIRLFLPRTSRLALLSECSRRSWRAAKSRIDGFLQVPPQRGAFTNRQTLDIVKKKRVVLVRGRFCNA